MTTAVEGGMVSLQLVVGSAVFRSQIEAFEVRPVRSHAKCDADKAPLVLRSVGGSVAGQTHFDRSILKGSAGNDGEAARVIQALRGGIGDAHSTTAKIGDRLRFYIVEFELVEREPGGFLSW